MTRNFKILGREPVVIVSAIQALLALIVSFNGLAFAGIDTQSDVAVVVLVLNGGAALLLAWTTKRTILAPVVELTKALLAFGAIYNFHLTDVQTGYLLGAIPLLVGLFHQEQTAPENTPISNP